jgi:hypothetical protein
VVDFTIIVRCYFVKVIGCALVIAAAVADFAAIVVRAVFAIVVQSSSSSTVAVRIEDVVIVSFAVLAT